MMQDYELRRNELRSILEAFACGDAMGMPTEFMTRSSIKAQFGIVDRLLEQSESQNHGDLKKGSVTDDTEQVLSLIEAYCRERVVDEQVTADALLGWIESSDAVRKKFIGPSSLKALTRIKEGTPPREAGRDGTTCGGIMRVLAAILCASPEDSIRTLEMRVQACLAPTHYTSQAMEAALAYSMAICSALKGDSLDTVIQQAIQGAQTGLGLADYVASAPSSAKRIAWVKNHRFASDDELLETLHDVLGTGLPSADVCGAVFAIVLHTDADVWKSICLASSVGGDTDTIAALAGALCAAYRKGHNIPADILETVKDVNGLDVPRYIEQIISVFGA